MRNRKKLIFIAPMAIVGVTLFVAGGGWIIMHLWNWLLPGLFGWKLITFWQALALLVLCRMLFGGFGGHGSSPFLSRRRMQKRMEERMDWMTPEERERFRERMRDKLGFVPAADAAEGSK